MNNCECHEKKTFPGAPITIKILQEPLIKIGVLPHQIIERNGGGPKYDGSYEVTPNFEEQILETKDKIMEQDVEVHKIPVWEVSNTAGGKTIIIGGEFNYG